MAKSAGSQLAAGQLDYGSVAELVADSGVVI